MAQVTGFVPQAIQTVQRGHALETLVCKLCSNAAEQPSVGAALLRERESAVALMQRLSHMPQTIA